MSKIIELDTRLADQIRAGEVVEFPVNVVKELVENAIDAGASRIAVRIEKAGLSKIEVVDNGEGIEAEDVPLAILRHATSKIREVGDLGHIRTLGFRGEAIPSILSVSHFTIETSHRKETAGTRLLAKGGRVELIESIGKAEGTRILVEELFYNTPARLKFVKSLHAEAGKISDMMNRISLAHPEIAFSLVADGRDQLRTSGSGDLQQALAGIYGLSSARKMVAIFGENLDFSIQGYVSLPELTRASRNYITLLVNGRYVKNFALLRAIIEGYGSKLMVGRFPLAVVSITADPHLVDVNIHPTKQEVKISNDGDLILLIKSAVRESLSDKVLIPGALREESFFSESLTTEMGDSPLEGPPSLQVSETKAAYVVNPVPDQEGVQKIGLDLPSRQDSSLEFGELVGETGFPELTYLSQLHLTYLLCEAKDGFYIVDQHAAQERVKYEYWRDKVGQVSYDQQTLLVPLILDFSKGDLLNLHPHLSRLEEVGIFLSFYGENQLILREHPVWMREGEIESTTREMVDLVLVDREFSVKKYREDLAIMVACKSSIKANMPIDQEGARSLLKQLAVCGNPYNCPHGRPAVVKFTSREMEKMFRRVQSGHASAKRNALES